jgi:acyl-coenzyme A synthetase/AMP-(fatty) acid ligase
MASESGTASTIVVRTEDIIVHNKAGSTGLPTLGADMKIIDPGGDIDDEMPVGDTGEIGVSSPSLAMGYWREPDLTTKKFVRGWWRSGDLGHIDADGYLWVDGRVDNVINTAGIKVHAEEVEAALIRPKREVICRAAATALRRRHCPGRCPSVETPLSAALTVFMPSNFPGLLSPRRAALTNARGSIASVPR